MGKKRKKEGPNAEDLNAEDLNAEDLNAEDLNAEGSNLEEGIFGNYSEEKEEYPWGILSICFILKSYF